LLGAFDRKWDLVICDYSMLYFSGTDAFRAVRARELEVPFIFVSGSSEVIAASLRRGGQDCVPKSTLKSLLMMIQARLAGNSPSRASGEN
jgi:CheY-like chemotaxis protein